MTSQCCILLAPIADQTVISAFNTNIFDISFSSFSALARNFIAEQQSLGQFPLTWVGRANNPSTIWIFNDRDGSDPVQSNLYLTSFVTNNVDRPNSQQGTALSVQSRGTGSGNFGFLNPVALNSQWRGSGILHQSIELWLAVPQNLGAGIIQNTVGMHVANHGIPGAATARGIEFENLATTNSRWWQLYVPTGNNWLGGDNTWAHKITLNCPPGELGCTDTFATLDVQPNGTMKYCSDCSIVTPASCFNSQTVAACTCTSGGTGAIAKRINSVWLCN